MNLKRNIIGKEESRKLKSWAVDYEKNMKALKEMLDNRTQANSFSNYNEYNTQDAWSKLDQRITDNTSIYLTLRRIAAALLILIAGIIVFKYLSNFNDSDKKQFIAETITNLSLPDGSKVLLDHSSLLSYSASEYGEQRSIKLEGRAFFDVEKDTQNPFTIKTDLLNIEVLGTKFTVMSFPDFARVIVEEGKVKVSDANSSVILEAGESLSYKDLLMTEDTYPSTNIYSWKTGHLKFDNEDIETVIHELAFHFNTTIKLDRESSNLACRLNTEFKNESLESILEEFKLLFGAEFTKQGKTISISNLQCD